MAQVPGKPTTPYEYYLSGSRIRSTPKPKGKKKTYGGRQTGRPVGPGAPARVPFHTQSTKASYEYRRRGRRVGVPARKDEQRLTQVVGCCLLTDEAFVYIS